MLHNADEQIIMDVEFGMTLKEAVVVYFKIFIILDVIRAE